MGSLVRTISLFLLLGASAALANAWSSAPAVDTRSNAADTLARSSRVFATLPIVGTLGSVRAKIPSGPVPTTLLLAAARLPRLCHLNFVHESDLHPECAATTRVYPPRAPPVFRG